MPEEAVEVTLIPPPAPAEAPAQQDTPALAFCVTFIKGARPHTTRVGGDVHGRAR